MKEIRKMNQLEKYSLITKALVIKAENEAKLVMLPIPGKCLDCGTTISKNKLRCLACREKIEFSIKGSEDLR